MFGGSLRREVADEVLLSVHQANVSEELRMLALETLAKPGRLLATEGASTPVALTLLSFASAAQREPTEIVPAAAAIEMLMAAGDLMDDVQDGEGPDVYDRHTVGEALEVISLLLLLCHRQIAMVAEVGIPPTRVLRALRTLDELGILAIRGQDLDVRLESATGVSTELALECTQLKAASLTRCATEIGAVLGTDEEEIVTLLARFGWHFGVVAQLMNDISAVWPNNDTKSDLRLRKKTLPVVFSLSDKALCQESRNLVSAYIYSENGCGISEATVKKAIWRCGGIHYSWFIAAAEKTRAAHISKQMRSIRPEAWSLGSLLS